MTCIVGLKHGDHIYMGGDRAASSGSLIFECHDSKVFIKTDARGNPFMMGYTSSFRMGQLLQYDLVIPEYSQGSVMQYMVSDFIKACRTCLKDGGYTRVDENTERGGTFLVACYGELFTIFDDFQVFRKGNFSVIGSGEEPALGSLFTTQSLDMSPEMRVKTALDTAVYFTPSVRPPFDILSIKSSVPQPLEVVGC